MPSVLAHPLRFVLRFIEGMHLSARNLSPGNTKWIWTVDPAVLHAIDFLAYRLGLFHGHSAANGTEVPITNTKKKFDRLNALAERSPPASSLASSSSSSKSLLLLSSSSSFLSLSACGKRSVHEDVCAFSPLSMMQEMMEEWTRRENMLALREKEMATRKEAEISALLCHPSSLFKDEAQVLFRFGMGAFVSPTAPGFSGLFRQDWRDFLVTEMVDDATGSGIPLSREPDWTIPDLPPSMLHADVLQLREDVDSGGNGDDDGDGPPPSFFTVNMEERLAELLDEKKEAGKQEGKHAEMGEGRSGGGSTVANINVVGGDEFVALVDNNSSTTSTTLTRGKRGRTGCLEKKKKKEDESCGLGRFYLQCYLHKQHMAHSVALSIIAQTLRMHPAGISVAGIKDYIGDTIQRVRLEKITPAAALEANRVFRQRKWAMTLSDFSYHAEPLVPGRLFGNHFKIVLRDVTAPREKVELALHKFALEGFPNYYGCQRFSWFGGKNDAAFALLHHNWLVFAFRFLGYTNRELTLRELLQREKKYPNPVQDEYRRNIVRRLRRIGVEPSELDVAPFISCPRLGISPTSVDGGPISKKQELIILQLHGAFLDLSMTSRRLTAQRLSSYLWNQVLTLRLHHFPGNEVLLGDMVLPEALRRIETSPEDRKDLYREVIHCISDEAERGSYFITDVVHPGFSFNGIKRPMNVVGEYYLQVCGKYHLDWYAQHTQAGIRDFLEPPRPILRKPMNLRYDYNVAESKLTLEFALERGSYANVAITELMKQMRCAGSDNILLLPAPDAMWELGGRDPGYVTSVQDIYKGFEEGLGFVKDEHEVPLVGEGRVWDYCEGALFLPESEDPVRKAYRWGERHLLRNMVRRERDAEAMKLRLFEKPLAKSLKDGEINQYAGHTVPISPNTKTKRVFFKVLRRQQRFPGAPKLAPRIKRVGPQARGMRVRQVPFRSIDKNTWNVTW